MLIILDFCESSCSICIRTFFFFELPAFCAESSFIGFKGLYFYSHGISSTIKRQSNLGSTFWQTLFECFVRSLQLCLPNDRIYDYVKIPIAWLIHFVALNEMRVKNHKSGYREQNLTILSKKKCPRICKKGIAYLV